MFNEQDIVDKDKATKAKEQTFLLIVIGLIIVIIITLIIVLTLTMNRTHRISLPPTLEFGKIVNTGEIDPLEVYSLAGPITQQLMPTPKKKPTWAARLNCAPVNRTKAVGPMASSRAPASRKRSDKNSSGGINCTASLENIKLMAASKVTIRSKRSALLLLDRGMHGSPEGRGRAAYHW